MNNFKNQKGFSLLEIMVSSFLSTIVMGAFFVTAHAYNANGDEVYVKMNMEGQGMNALQNMEHELRGTAPSRITLGGGGSSITFSVPDESAPTVASTYAVNWTGAHLITYSVLNNQLIRTDDSASVETTSRKLCNFVSSVNFATPSSGVITITLNLSQSLNNTRTITRALTARVQTRNP